MEQGWGTFEQRGVAIEERDAGTARRLFRASLGAFVASWIAGTAGLGFTVAGIGEIAEALAGLGVSMFFLAPFVAGLGLVAALRAKRRAANVSVARGVLDIAPIGGGSGRLVSRSAIASAVHTVDGVVVITLREGDVLRIELGAALRADALLDALAIGAPSSRAVISWQSALVREGTRAAMLAAVTIAGIGTAFVAGELWPMVVWNLPFAAIVVSALVARSAGLRELEIGADVITARASSAAARSVRLADVAEVHRAAREIVLVLRDGRRIAMPADAPAEVRRAIERRIEEVRARAADRQDDAMLATLLDPTGRTW
ncbi:MAG: hypothetical protein M3Y87_10425, partial [Myxococcota bacterium]|nr:hypothetical protein [Myxococcota bacterium]